MQFRRLKRPPMSWTSTSCLAAPRLRKQKMGEPYLLAIGCSSSIRKDVRFSITRGCLMCPLPRCQTPFYVDGVPWQRHDLR